jgi:nucleoside-diphosphate-sugar epimerase
LKKQISIIGCGWLGLPLAKNLITEGYTVKGSTTSKEKLINLRSASIDAHLIKLNEDGITGNYSKFLSESDTIIINIPPGLRRNAAKNHVNEIKHLISAIESHNIKNVLYIGSTSVFMDEEGFPVITENTKPNTKLIGSKQLVTIEQLLLNNSNFNTTVLRFGGLFDQQRHPAKKLSGKKNILNPEAPINLIHKNDCIHIISEILEKDVWNISLNAAHPKHPDKETYYSNYCERYNLYLPTFNDDVKSKGKIIDSSKLVQLLNYRFKQAL